MSWTNEIEVKSRNRYGITLGRDEDGDIAFLDQEGYSIGIHRDEAPRLIEWLQEFIRASVPQEL